MKALLQIFSIFFSLTMLTQVTFQKAPNPNFYPQRGNVNTIVASIPYQGYEETQEYFGQGEYEIFLDNVDQVLDQPIIVLDGFDPGDGRDIGGLYASLTFDGQNLADILRNEGYDIVVLNAPQYTTGGKDIDGGADYIQRNAFVLVELINELNAQKVGDAELVVLGPSMGGLIARYALAYMEQNNLDSETRLYISFDSPHRGANIPISLQYLINYFAQDTGDATALALVNEVLNSPAAKEMLIDHLAGHLLPGSNTDLDPTKLLPFGAPNFRDAFQAELDNLGFASNVRNVTMINGTSLGTTVGMPGMTIVDTNIQIDALTSVDIALTFTPEANQTQTVTDVTAFFIGFPVGGFDADAQSPSFTDGVDAAPGGTASLAGALGGGSGNPILDAFIAALQQDTYSFIPTMSALAIDNNNWYATPNLNDSPFVNFYIPTENEDHVTVTAASAQFALDEIRQTLGIENEVLNNNITLLQNPIENVIKLSLNNINEPLTLQLFSLSGQLIETKIFQNTMSIIKWEKNLSSGIYILTAKSGNYQNNFKLIVK